MKLHCPSCDQDIETVIEIAKDHVRYDWAIIDGTVDVIDSTPLESETVRFQCPECEHAEEDIDQFIRSD